MDLIVSLFFWVARWFSRVKSAKLIFIVPAIFTPGTVFAYNDATLNFSSSLLPCSQKTLLRVEQIMETLADRPVDVCSLTGLSKKDLRLLRNSVYARHGRKFETPELRDFFTQQSWYHVNNEYNDTLLTKTEIGNAKLILAIEEMHYAVESGANHSDLSSPNFPPLKQFLVPIAEQPKEHPSLSFADSTIFFKKTGKKIGRSPQSDYFVLDDSVLINSPDGIDSCSMEFFDFSGNKIIYRNADGIPYAAECSNYIYRYNKNLLISADAESCCGFFNKKTGVIANPTYTGIGESLKDYLLTYIPNTMSIVVGIFEANDLYLRTQVWIFTTNGDYAASGSVMQLLPRSGNRNEFNYSLSNLTGIIEIEESKSWLLRFSTKTRNEFIVLSNSSQGAKDKTALIVKLSNTEMHAADVFVDDKYKGKTPYSSFVEPGKYLIRLSTDGYTTTEINVTTQPGEFEYVVQQLQPLSTRRQ